MQRLWKQGYVKPIQNGVVDSQIDACSRQKIFIASNEVFTVQDEIY